MPLPVIGATVDLVHDLVMWRAMMPLPVTGATAVLSRVVRELQTTERWSALTPVAQAP